MYDPFFSWHLDIPILIGLVAAECIYVLLVRRLWHKAGHYDMRSAWSWSIGVAVIFIALESPLDTIAEQRLLSAHMVQHELLLTIAPTLLLLGLFPRLVAPVTRVVFKPLLRNRYTYPLLRVIFSPYCTLAIWLLCLYTWHLPSLYLLALKSDPLHRVEHLSFVTAGLLFWLPIIEPVPGLTKMRPLRKLGYLALGQLGTVPLVAALFWSPTPLYPYYASKLPLWGISHLSDQQWAGLVMMIVDMLAALTAVCWITLKALAWAEWQDNRSRPLHVSPPTQTLRTIRSTDKCPLICVYLIREVLYFYTRIFSNTELPQRRSTMTTADTTKTGYHIKGDLLEACSCVNLCPCSVGDDPDSGQCWTSTGYHISQGTIRGVDVSNLSVVSLVQSPGHMAAGNLREVLFVDGSATDEQAQALIDAFQGRLGGGLAEMAALVSEQVATYRTAIEFTSSGGKGTLRVASPQGQGYALDANMEAYRGPDGNPTQLVNSLSGAMLGGPIEVGKASSHTVSLPEHQMQWSYTGHSAMQGNFDLQA